MRRDFRSVKRLKGQDEYYFTAFESALEFIEKMDETKLALDKEEFRRLTEESRAKLDIIGELYDAKLLPNVETSPEKEAGLIGGQTPNQEKQKSAQKEVVKTQGFETGDERESELQMLKEMNQTKNVIINKFLNLRYIGNVDEKKMKFAGKTVETLTVAEVAELLNDYKTMVVTHQELRTKLNDTIDKSVSLMKDLKSQTGNPAANGKDTKKFLGLF